MSRTVTESTASRTLVARDSILTRIVDHEGLSVICGLHGRSLPPLEAAEVVRRIRGRLRRKREVPPERLRGYDITRYAIRRWDEAVDEFDERRAGPPALRNTDGEDLLLTVDHFDIEPGARIETGQVIGTLEGTKAVSDIHTPLSGLFEGVNPDLEGEIRLLDTDSHDI